MPPERGVWNLSHWTAREVLFYLLDSCKSSLILVKLSDSSLTAGSSVSCEKNKMLVLPAFERMGCWHLKR